MSETPESQPIVKIRATDAIVSVIGLVKVYNESRQRLPVRALDGVDLEIGAGEFTAIVGPSGSGKTTLLNLIGGLDYPTSGSVVVAGKDLSTLNRSELADFRLWNLGFIFQAYNLIPVLTAYENAEFTLLLRGVDAGGRGATVRPLLERVGLGDMMDRKPHELSGGQQQRVAIVRALATSPRLVLADEPTANLDSATSEGLLDLMAELNAELGTTFIFSTHDAVVIDRAHRVVELRDGRVHRTRVDP